MGYYVRATGARGERWQQLYGTDTLPVVSLRPERASVGGEAGQFILEVDLDALTQDEREAVARGVATARGLSLEEVEHILLEQGLPVVVDEGNLEVRSEPDGPRGLEYRFG
jgi:hypothetical protein